MAKSQIFLVNIYDKDFAPPEGVDSPCVPSKTYTFFDKEIAMDTYKQLIENLIGGEEMIFDEGGTHTDDMVSIYTVGADGVNVSLVSFTRD